MKKKCDLVFSGGGVKGIGFVGAVNCLEDAGYEFINMAGTSAGSIVASLLAVGYTGQELKKTLMETDFSKFQGKDMLTQLSTPGKIAKIIWKKGVYHTNYIEKWLTTLYAAKGKTKFKDIEYINVNSEKYKYKFQAVASDISSNSILVLPRDLKHFGYVPGEFEIAKAVRMSISIPLYFEPYHLKDSLQSDHIIVDGGLLSNYPIWLLDSECVEPAWPTFGLKFVNDDYLVYPKEKIQKMSTLSYFKSLAKTSLSSHDNIYISNKRGDNQRSIKIPTVVEENGVNKKIYGVDFQITPEESLQLYENGYNACKKFLAKWNFLDWKKKFRNPDQH